MEGYRERLIKNVILNEKRKREVQEQLENEMKKAPENRNTELIADLKAHCEYIAADIKRYDDERRVLDGLFFSFFFLLSFFFRFIFKKKKMLTKKKKSKEY